VMAISFAIQGMTFLFVGLGGNWFSTDMQGALWYFCFCFIVVGAI